MRNLPKTTRIAIATLYIRYRDARHNTQRIYRQNGRMSPPAFKAKEQELAVWNALQAVLSNIHEDRRPLPTREFLRLVAARRAPKINPKAA